MVSYYHYGKRTANGERFYPDRSTFASRHLPFGTLVEFRYNGKRVVARCNDRGPFVKGRAFDLSRGAAKKLGILQKGVATVQYQIIRTPERKHEDNICQQQRQRKKPTAPRRTAKARPRPASSRS